MPKKAKGKQRKGGKPSNKKPNNKKNEEENDENDDKENDNENTTEQADNEENNEPEEKKENPDDPVLILKQKGNDEFEKKNYKKAIEHYTEGINLDKQNHTLYSNRSAAYTKNEEYDKAIQDADECLRLQPDWAKGYLRKGTVYQELKKLDEAEATLKLGLEKCAEKQLLHKALNELDLIRLNTIDRADKIVGGHHEQAEKFRALIRWLLDNGAKFPKLYLKFYSPEYRAIHAIDRVAKDEDICFIPHDCIMTSELAKQAPIGKAMVDLNLELRSKHSYLASYLLQERDKGEQSKWFHYITILPKKFETIPLFFTNEQRNELEGSMAIKKIDDRIESLRLEYNAICDAIPAFKQFSHDDFVWARLVVITRIFGMVINDIKTDGLVPMADMLNHKRPRETKWAYEEKQKGFVITALQNLKKDSEIFDSYGRKCNSRFFVNYGFSLEENEDNEAIMIFEFSGNNNNNDPYYALKLQHLGLTPNNARREFQIPMQYKEKKVKECFSFLRIMHAYGNEFLVISSNTDNNGNVKVDEVPFLSIRNETNVLTSLAVAASKALKKFPTTLEHDNNLLKDEEKYPRFSNQRNIVLMRRGEKVVLQFYIDLLKICGPLLKMKFKDLASTLKRDKHFKDLESPLVEYVNGVVVPLVRKESGQ